jgi:modulator of FtsH protease HflK
MFLETMERLLRNNGAIVMDPSAGQGVVPYLPLNELTQPRPAAPAGAPPASRPANPTGATR